MLDLRFLSLGQHNIASFARKADARAFAAASGKWRPSDAFQAYNRFCAYWVIGQVFGDDIILLTRDGTSTTIRRNETAEILAERSHFLEATA